METVLYILCIVAAILMIVFMLLTIADVGMTLAEKRRKKKMLDKLDGLTAMLGEAVAADLAEAEKHIFIVSEKDFEDDGK